MGGGDGWMDGCRESKYVKILTFGDYKAYMNVHGFIFLATFQ